MEEVCGDFLAHFVVYDILNVEVLYGKYSFINTQMSAVLLWLLFAIPQ